MVRQLEKNLRPVRLPDGEEFGLLGRLLMPVVRPIAGRILRIEALNDAYERVCLADPSEEICARILREIGVDFEPVGLDADSVPTSGPLVVVANHPFGGVEGLILGAWLRTIRSDVRIMANHLLGALPALRDLFLFVDPFEGPESERRNRGPLRAALNWLGEGGVLVIFPAGEVAHLSIRPPRIADPPWRRTASRLVARTGASVLPVFFDGRNSMLFQLLGLVHPRLRTCMLPHEMLNKRSRRLRFAVGTAIPASRLTRIGDAERETAYLRARTHILSSRFAPASADAHHRSLEPIVPPGPTEDLEREFLSLGEDTCLASCGQFGVYLETADRIPLILQEIARLREIAFREVGEGTGRACDTDEFDAWYRHLFVWDRAKRQVVGAYRLGCTDEIVAKYEIGGLYTSRLFSYGKRLLKQIDPAIELGRSFVRPEYQRAHAPLMLLWKGIGRFVAANPRYRRLFGPVTISSAYHGMSQRLLIEFLRSTRLPSDLAAMLRPRHPVRYRNTGGDPQFSATFAVGDVEEIEELVEEIESDLRGIPVLLRQYLRLNGKLLGFAVDPDFANSIDGLMLVDLARVDQRVLRFYLGDEAAARLLA